MIFGASCTLSAIPILRFGTEEQKKKYLEPLAKGETIGALAVTEPKVGSDTAGMETTAVWNEDENCWILNGENANEKQRNVYLISDQGYQGSHYPPQCIESQV